MDQQTEMRVAQADRGRAASTPTAIPPKGWKDIAWRLYRALGEDRVMLTAAGVSFYLVLALVPTLTAVVALYGLFADRASVVSHLALLDGIVPPAALGLIADQLTRLAARPADTLGITLLISLAIALWSASAGVKAMFEAMNVAYAEEEERNFFQISGLALLFTLGGALAAILVAVTVIAMPPMLALFPLGPLAEIGVRVAAYAVMLAILWFALSALYRWGPSRQTARWRWIAPGTLLAVLGLGIGSILFSWYVTNFSDYDAAYGSLGAMIALLTWFWLSTIIVILGAELNSEIEHQTARDTTTGPEEPLGERGAYMADHGGRVWPPARKRLEPELRPERERQRFNWGRIAASLPFAALMMRGQRGRR
ncbi:MAG: YihY/virulence factor BrkB family protein [Devosia sp.]